MIRRHSVGPLAGPGCLRACPDQRVARQGRVFQLGRHPGTGERKPFGIDETGLDQHRTLVPVEMLAGDLGALEPDDRQGRDCDLAACRSETRQGAVDDAVMREG